MKLKNKVKSIGVVCLLSISIVFTGCQTYHISTTSLLEQLADTHKEKKERVLVAFPFFLHFTVTGNSLRQVSVLDKNETPCVIPVTGRTGVRITKKDGTRKTFYFDTLIIKDSLITGKNDHFIGVAIRPINLNNIEKIELQK